MHEQNNPIISVKVPAVQFESNKDFQNKGRMYDDSGFLRSRRKWMQPQVDSQTNREILSTLLTTQENNSTENVERLIAEDISYRDLASLTHQDLELMGFSRPKQRDELLLFFGQLPNQNPSIQQIYQLKEASNYNREIIDNAVSHLESMQSALAAANYKLEIMPPEDVVVGDKSFASRFVLEALHELYGVADEIEKEISAVGSIVNTCKLKPDVNTRNETSKIRKFYYTACFISLSSIGALLAIYFWKYNK